MATVYDIPSAFAPGDEIWFNGRTMLRATLTALAALCLCACQSAPGRSPDAAAPDAAADLSPRDMDLFGKIVVRVLTANVGNLDEAEKTTCPAYHKGSQCELSLEQIIAGNIAKHAPDIVVLNEVWDTDRCAGVSEKTAGFVCHAPAKLSPAQQARRYLGAGYTIVCDGVAHFDCIGVKTKRVALDPRLCSAGGLCLGKAVTPAHPKACAGMGSITSVSSADVTVDGVTFTVVNGHPKNAYNNVQDPCRLAQYKQIFEELAVGKRNLIMGDMNGDAIRFPAVFPSFVYWNTRVGPGKRFRYHSGPAEATPPPPTWMNSVTLDYVLSDFAQGVCNTLGKKADRDRLDHPRYRMDHLGIVCDLILPKK